MLRLISKNITESSEDSIFSYKAAVKPEKTIKSRQVWKAKVFLERWLRSLHKLGSLLRSLLWLQIHSKIRKKARHRRSLQNQRSRTADPERRPCRSVPPKLLLLWLQLRRIHSQIRKKARLRRSFPNRRSRTADPERRPCRSVPPKL